MLATTTGSGSKMIIVELVSSRHDVSKKTESLCIRWASPEANITHAAAHRSQTSFAVTTAELSVLYSD